MASTDARPVPKKNVAYRVYLPIYDADGDLVTGAAGLDSEVSKDGGNYADCTNEATEIQSTGTYFLDLTSTEMDADSVVVIVKTTTVGAKTTPIFLYPEEAGDIRVDVTQLGSSTQSATDLKDFADDGYDPATNKVEGVKLVDTLTTYTGNTVQTGDSFARIGALGAGLTGIPWNAAWDVEVESEVADALLAYDPPTRAEATADKDEILADTNDIQTRLPAALVGGRMDSSVGAMAADVLTAAATAADFGAEIADAVWDEALAGHAGAGSAGAALSAAGAAGDPWAIALPGAYGAGTAGFILGTNLDVASSTIKTKTDALPASPAAVGSAMTLSVAERASVADKILGRTRAGGADGGRTVAECLAISRNRFRINAGVLTVYADDDTTPLWTSAVTTAAGNPLVESDPA